MANAPKIYSAYGERPPRPVTPAGNRMEPHYIELYDKYGQPYLEQDGETDTYEEIQSYRDSCDIHTLLERYANGDLSVMNQRGVYADISGMPSTWHEVFNTLQKQRAKFDELPIDIKGKFGHSFEQWAAQAGTEAWAEKMGLIKEKPEAVKEAAKNES